MAEIIGYNRNAKIGKRMSKETQKRLKDSMRRLEMGQGFRAKERESEWRDSYNLYMGDAWPTNPDDPTADIVNVNVAFSTINTLVPFVADEDPSFLITPYSGDASAENAQLLQSFLNRLWQSSDVRGQTDLSDATFDYLLYGDGWLKVGYAVKEKEIYDALGDKVTNKVRIASFQIDRINPWDVWIDPYSDGLHNARWLCQRITLPIQELIDDERYKIKNEDDMDAGSLSTDNMSPEDQSRLNDVNTESWVTIYEFYDLVNDYMIAFTPGAQRAIRYIEHITAPFVQMANYRVPNNPYHLGDIEQISSLQHELNKTRSQMITHRRRNVAKWVVRGHLLSDEAHDAMKSSIVNDVIDIEAQEPIESIIQYIAPMPMSADSYQMDAQIRADINEITGVNEYLRGVPQDISRTATEATIIEGATNIRTRHKLLQIERAARDTGQLLLDIIRDVLPLTDFEEMKQFITGREAEHLNRATGAVDINTDLIFTPTPEIFQGRYEVQVERGSTELRNPQIKAQKLGQQVQIMIGAMPLLMQVGIPFNLQHLLELWFEAEGIDDVDALFEQTEEQMFAQQMQQAEQMAGIMGGMTPSGSSAPSPGGGGGTPAGQPRPQTANAPEALPDSSNSGMLPSR